MTKFYDDPEIIAKLLSRRITEPPRSGDRFGMLTFSGRFLYCCAGISSKAEFFLSGEFRCACGSIHFRRLSARKRVVDCGCTVALKTATRNKAVALYPPHITAIYKLMYSAWRNFRERCYDAKNSHYHRYGGRGIYVSDEWKDNFKAFLFWAYENGFRRGLSLERINNDGPYAPWNCKWAGRKEQCRNRGTNHVITAWGEAKCLIEWVEDPRCVVEYATVHCRLKAGADPEIALSTPSTKESSLVGYTLAERVADLAE